MRKITNIYLLMAMLLLCYGCALRKPSDVQATTNILNNTNIPGIDNVNTKLLTSKILHVSLRYSKDWIQNGTEDQIGTQEFEGQDGYFSIGCVTGNGLDVDAFTKQDIKDRKYDPSFSDKKPIVSSIKIDNQEARLIVFSSNGKEQDDDATLYVEYPKNIEIRGMEHARGTIARFNIFELIGDKNNIMKIAKTIRFEK